MLPEKLAAAVRLTMDEINEELSACDPLFRIGKIREFDFIETAAAASILQSFYTGIENLILYLSKTLDGSAPQSSSWHRELLSSAAEPTITRSAILGVGSRQLLLTYLDFRHVVRHGYARRLKADRTRELFTSLPPVWKVVQEDLEKFILSLKTENNNKSDQGNN